MKMLLNYTSLEFIFAKINYLLWHLVAKYYTLIISYQGNYVLKSK